MIEMEPMECAVDEETYRIIKEWFGPQVADKLLYEAETCSSTS